MIGKKDIIGRIDRLKEEAQYRDGEYYRLQRQVDRIESSFAECDICGCLLKKSTAIRGESTVEKVGEHKRQLRSIYEDVYLSPMFVTPEHEVIKEHYYCKIHVPKKKK